MSLPPKLLSFLMLTVLGGAVAVATSDHPLVDRALGLLQAKHMAAAAVGSIPSPRVVATAGSHASGLARGLSQVTGASLGGNLDKFAVERALSLLQTPGAAAAAHVSPDDRFVPRGSVLRDADGTEHVRFDRTYEGLPVIGGDFVVHSRGGQLKSTSQTLTAALSLSTRPVLKNVDAIVNAGVEFGSTFTGMPTSGLVVYARNADAPKLAWQVNFLGSDQTGAPVDAAYFVDATNGKVLDHWSRIETAGPGKLCTPTSKTPAVGVGKSLYSGNRVLNTTNCGAGFELKDQTRGGNSTRNMQNAWDQLGPGAPFNDPDNSFGNNAMTDVATIGAEIHAGIANIWDYYKNVHGRLGINNDGVGIVAKAHYGLNYFNAAWWDRCQCIIFGDGDGVNTGPMASLDMTGHEMSHGLTSHTAGLFYSGESGGLNEGNSDIFGTMAEFYANSPSDPPDYMLGEKLYLQSTGTSALRFMYEPFRDGLSPNCYSSNIGKLDVHYSSGIANHFYYLLAEGSAAKTWNGLARSSPTCNKQPVVGITRAKAEKIWYRGLTVYMTANTNYAGARVATLKAANDLYGVNSVESKTVAVAWTAVMVR
jgi:zinc metalloprotease ZmpA